MEKRYINESRYKKGTTRKRRDATTVKSNLKPKIKASEVKVKNKKQVKKKVKQVRKQNKVTNIIICGILLILIGIISRAILKDENEPFIPLFFSTNENEEVIRIGVITEDNLNDLNSNNVVLSELKKYSTDMLLVINEDYSITYKCIANVTKLSNKEYNLIRNEKSNVTAQKIKECLESYKQNKTSIYYTKLNNIQSITVVDENTINVKLKLNDPYFVYSLEISLDTNLDQSSYVKDSASTTNKLIFNRHEDANKELPLKVTVMKYKDMYAAVNAYKENGIDIFVTNAENVENILGKYEYNIKTYRNGKSVFLFGNPESELYEKAEVRQAIVYSINRDSIIKDVLKSKGDKIDLPYIYDVTKYKYDVYATENLLLTNKYEKVNKVYTKTENGKKTTLELNLLVNKNDEIKVSIANRIKNNLNSVGIKVNIERLTESKINTRIKKGTYDLLLASVNLNNNPDIYFVQNNLYITENVKQAILNIDNSAVQDLNTNIMNLQNTLSQDISAIGIYGDVSYLVYSKNIIGLDNVSYMNLFKNILE